MDGISLQRMERLRDINDNNHMSHMLMEIFVKKVEQQMLDEVLPSIKENIRTYAIEAVKDWSVNVDAYLNHSSNGFDMETIVNVAFVENILNTIVKDNNIKVTVN